MHKGKLAKVNPLRIITDPIFCIYGTCSVEADRFMMCYSVTKFTNGSQLFVDVCFKPCALLGNI